MTANSLEEKPAIQASNSTTKMIRLLAPAFPLIPFIAVVFEGAATAFCGFDLFVAPACCAIFLTVVVVVDTQKHDTHTVHMDWQFCDSLCRCQPPPPPTGSVGRCYVEEGHLFLETGSQPYNNSGDNWKRLTSESTIKQQITSSTHYIFILDYILMDR